MGLKREQNPAWKGGRYTDRQGYVLICVGKGHHLANKRGYALEHRVIAEQKIGRHLAPREIAHHINGIRSDNRPKNIEVIESHSEHVRSKHCHCTRMKDMQRLGANAKRRKTLEVRLPHVLSEIRSLIARGIRPSMSNCAGIVGYPGCRMLFKHTGLVQRATEELA